MRHLTVITSVVAVFSTTVAVVLWGQLSTERANNAALQARLADAGVAAAAAPTVQSAATTPSSGVASEPAKPTGTVAPAPAAVASSAQPVRITTNYPSERDMLKDPEYRKARLAQMRLSLTQGYPGLAEAMGLSPDETDRLFDIIAENQLEQQSSAIILSSNGQVDQTQIAEMARNNQMMQTKLEESIRGQLGDARFAQWQDYQTNQRPARMQVAQYGRTLEAAGVPLNSAQMRPLTELMVAEQARRRAEQMAMVRQLPQNSSQPMDSSVQARLQEESLKLQADSNKRLLDAAAAHLDARQIEALKASFEQQLAMSRASSRLLRESQSRAQGN
jgi:hypothetical protein